MKNDALKNIAKCTGRCLQIDSKNAKKMQQKIYGFLDNLI